jgi:hypothetical protein
MGLEIDQLCYHHMIFPRIELLLIFSTMLSFNTKLKKDRVLNI